MAELPDDPQPGDEPDPNLAEPDEPDEPTDPEPDEPDPDEPEPDEDEPSDDDEPEPQPEPRRGRANDEIRRLRERAQRAERERDEFRRSATPADPGRAQREWEEREARLLQEAQQREDLGERGAVARYHADRVERINAARYQSLENRTLDREDARDFRAICREDGISRDLQDYVEGVIRDARANGNYFLTREAVLNHRLGQLARQGKSERLGKQRERGERRILRQTTKPPRGGGEAPRPRGGRRNFEELSAEEMEAQIGGLIVRNASRS